jgi:PHD/YefM family antitoxin component YafN of YafNO toxin-antitoxin module
VFPNLKNPSAVLIGAHGGPVAVLNHNRVMGYTVPADVFETMMDRLDAWSWLLTPWLGKPAHIAKR